MPIRSAQGITAAPLYDVTITLISERGYLTAASAYEPNASRGSAELFGQISIGSIDTPTIRPQLLIASGYFGAEQLLGWTGRILLTPSTIIIGQFRSLVSTEITLAINTEPA